jgi:hypothetical protein
LLPIELYYMIQQPSSSRFSFINDGIQYIKRSKMAKILLIIILIKFLIFYGFLKGFLYPRYLKPKWESEQHRIESVTHDLIQPLNTISYD